ncbi:hypothetical protein FDP41_010016 [Naegleria fowleri]|uniref:FBA domain-containing protein n=1 Tax=Naegleria fowleri TaxID=5763 RepID=A0A6A5ATW8_NAEFO|nr:uncharacterized protein FDP41_010016 [Naegleria fowleri]KAF0971793.1 hypothetical protein FDP41_010016 [Naegleria fowleri]CAG4717860.1 unnamed protein product [Naegleria fowleri]
MNLLPASCCLIHNDSTTRSDHHHHSLTLFPPSLFQNSETLHTLTSISCSFSIFLLEQEYNATDQLNILQKGKSILIALSKFRNLSLIVKLFSNQLLEPFQIHVNGFELETYCWYHLKFMIKEEEIKIIVWEYNEMIFEFQSQYPSPLNIKEIANEFCPIIIPPKLDKCDGVKGLIKDLFFECSNQKNSTHSEHEKFNYDYPPFIHCNKPHKIISQPIYSMEQLKHFKIGSDPMNVCHVKLHKRKKSHENSKVILCHDMKGGYLEDKYIQGGRSFLSYNFNYWQYVDIFIYFSHFRISIPPCGWCEAAHRNGVQVLGNFIVEWDEGISEIEQLLYTKHHVNNDSCHSITSNNHQENSTLSYELADKLVDLALYYGFDGWFLNIESPLKKGRDACERMIKLLKYLTRECHRRIGKDSLVIWYDSVLSTNGELKWQNELNEKNIEFFNSCDGIFLNYCWKPEMLSKSVSLCNHHSQNSNNNNNTDSTIVVMNEQCPTTSVNEHPMTTTNLNPLHEERSKNSFDIYTGIDIFGRGQYGGGQFNTTVALAEIIKARTSVALFAPGFVYETLRSISSEDLKSEMNDPSMLRRQYEEREDLFWSNHVHGNDVKNVKELLQNGNGQENNFKGWTILLPNKDYNNESSSLYDGYHWSLSSSCEFNDSKSFIASHQWCRMSQLIDLTSHFTLNKEKNDSSEPLVIRASCWYKGTPPKCDDLFYLIVELRDEHHQVIDSFHSGEMICNDKWKCIHHCFMEYSTDIRYIYWEHGGKDVEGWSGNYGPRVAQCSLTCLEFVNYNCSEEISPKFIRNYIEERSIPSYCCCEDLIQKEDCNIHSFLKNNHDMKHDKNVVNNTTIHLLQKNDDMKHDKNVVSVENKRQQHLKTRFNTGVGQYYFIHGEKVSDHSWNNMSHQELMPTFRNVKYLDRGQPHALRFYVNYDDAWIGGSCLHFEGKFNQQSKKEQMTRFKLFKTNMDIEEKEWLHLRVGYKPICESSTFNLILKSIDREYVFSTLNTISSPRFSLNSNKDHFIQPSSVETRCFSNMWRMADFILHFPTSCEIIGMDIECFRDSREDNPLYSLMLGLLEIHTTSHNCRSEFLENRSIGLKASVEHTIVTSVHLDQMALLGHQQPSHEANISWNHEEGKQAEFVIFKNQQFVATTRKALYRLCNYNPNDNFNIYRIE